MISLDVYRDTEFMDPAHPLEIELKLALPPGQVEAFRKKMARRRAAKGTRSVPQQQTLVTRYFDTPDFALSALGVALRVRQVGQDWLQTLKTAAASQGGLSRRVEYEMPVEGDFPDWARFPPEAREFVPEALRARLRPVFETRFDRTAWQIAGKNGARIEVALDIGAIRVPQDQSPDAKILAGERTVPLCEVELELEAGEPDALFALALEWAEAFDCLPLDASKAARGIALARAEPPAAVRARTLALDAGMRVEEGFAAACQACLEQFQANLHGVFESDDIEYLHQARVALRRLRAALRLYRRACMLPGDLTEALRRITAALAPARDWDVLCGETLPAIAAHFPDAAWHQGVALLETRRAEVRTRMRSVLHDARPGLWLLAMQRWLLRQGWRADEAGQTAPSPRRDIQRARLKPWARRALDRGQRRIVRRARKFGQASAAERHALRIAIKRQRYAAEFFETLFEGARKRHGRRQARYLAALRTAQDSLGRANDARVAAQSLHDVDAGPGGTFALGWLAAERAGASAGRSARPVRAVLKAKTYW